MLSLVVLFAQLGAVVHASSHLDSDPHGAPAQQQVCGKCLSFQPLQDIVGGAPAVLPDVDDPADRVVDCDESSVAPQREFTAFRSRAPPASLQDE